MSFWNTILRKEKKIHFIPPKFYYFFTPKCLKSCNVPQQSFRNSQYNPSISHFRLLWRKMTHVSRTCIFRHKLSKFTPYIYTCWIPKMILPGKPFLTYYIHIIQFSFIHSNSCLLKHASRHSNHILHPYILERERF